MNVLYMNWCSSHDWTTYVEIWYIKQRKMNIPAYIIFCYIIILSSGCDEV